MTAPTKELGVGVRYIVAGFLLAYLGSRSGPTRSVWLLAGLVIAYLLFDRQHPLCLKNFFLLYVIGIFGLGTILLRPEGPPPYSDMVVYFATFIGAYALSRYRKNGVPEPEAPNESPNQSSATQARLRGTRRTVEVALLGFLCLNLLLLASNLFLYGPSAFYRGQSLADQFFTYSKANLGGGAVQIITFFVKYTTLACVVVYAQVCFESGANVRYWYPFLLFVGVPAISLRRSDAALGAVALLAVYAWERKVVQVHGLGHAASDGHTLLLPRRRSRLATMLAVLAVTFVVAIGIGLLRKHPAAQATEPTSPIERTLPILQSELTPIFAYNEIKLNIDTLGHPYGRTIVLPVLFKVVPRAWFPGKPLNSGAYYMTVVRPQEFAGGFAIPPTFFGDAYLSFGMAGAVLACALLGAVASRLDLAFRQARVTRFPWFFIVFANFYALLRDPLSESLAAILLTVLTWAVFVRWFGLKIRVPTGPRT